MIAHGVVKSSNDVGQVAGPIGGEGLEWKELGIGSNEVHKPGSHRSVSKGNIGRTVQNGRRGLIQNGGSRLLNEASLLVLPLIVITLPRHVEPFGGTLSISGRRGRGTRVVVRFPLPAPAQRKMRVVRR